MDSPDPTGAVWNELDELDDLFAKEPSPPSALEAFQVQLNGDLAAAVPDLPIALDDALSSSSTRLDATLNSLPGAATTASPAAPAASTGQGPTTAVAASAAAAALVLKRTAAVSSEAASHADRIAVKAEPMLSPAPASGRVEKRAPASLKEKRAREAAQFPRALLSSLAGTTSAEVRKMSAQERELVMYKRKLRNRESARRSRAKRQATVAELQDEVGDLLAAAAGVVDRGIALQDENARLRTALDAAEATIRTLQAATPAADAAAGGCGVADVPGTPTSPMPAEAASADAATARKKEEEGVPVCEQPAKGEADMGVAMKMQMGG